MITLKMISEKIDAWFRYRKEVRELSQLSDHELCDIGVRRSDIESRDALAEPAAEQALRLLRQRGSRPQGDGTAR